MKKWNKLDNAAKIFPATIEQSETRVFRFYCELTQEIQPEILQQAVDRALIQLPQFQNILRTGLFWYYLEHTDLKPIVQEESQSPCSHIYRYGHQDLLFNVTYYKKRINLEVFHVLADGAGAISFLKCILAAYINLLHPGTLPEDHPLLKNTVAVEDMEVDAFNTYYTGEKNPRKAKKTWVWRLYGKRRPDLDLNITEGVVSVKQVLEVARSHKATMTEFLVAVFIKSIIKNFKPRNFHQTLVIDVPINLRNYFPSETTRNFFVMMPIEYKPTSKDDSFEMICESVSKEFARIITVENLAGRINSYGGFERKMGMRLVPLFLKDPGLRFVNFMIKRFVTGCVSNLGKVTLPEEIERYVNQWGVYSSTLNIQTECISFKDNLTIGITDAFYDVTLVYDFFETLQELGIDVKLHTNTPAVKKGHRYVADPSIPRAPQPDDVFPVPASKKHKLKGLVKIVNILSILLLIAYAIFFVVTDQHYNGLLIIAINTFLIWFSIISGMLNKKSVLRKLFITYSWTSAIYLGIDILTGWNQWSLNTQAPAFLLITMALSLLWAYLVPTETTTSELSLFVSWECFIGIILLILSLTGILELFFLPMFAGIVSIVLLLLLLVFRRASLKHEYKKTFHF